MGASEEVDSSLSRCLVVATRRLGKGFGPSGDFKKRHKQLYHLEKKILLGMPECQMGDLRFGDFIHFYD